MVRIRFQFLDVQSIADSSGVFHGENRHTGWRHDDKRNEGLGTVSGQGNKVTFGHYTVVDQDQVDMYSARQGKAKPS